MASTCTAFHRVCRLTGNDLQALGTTVTLAFAAVQAPGIVLRSARRSPRRRGSVLARRAWFDAFRA